MLTTDKGDETSSSGRRSAGIPEPETGYNKDRMRLLIILLGILIVILIAASVYELFLGNGLRETGSERMKARETGEILAGTEGTESVPECTESASESKETLYTENDSENRETQNADSVSESGETRNTDGVSESGEARNADGVSENGEAPDATALTGGE